MQTDPDPARSSDSVALDLDAKGSTDQYVGASASVAAPVEIDLDALRKKFARFRRYYDGKAVVMEGSAGGVVPTLKNAAVCLHLDDVEPLFFALLDEIERLRARPVVSVALDALLRTADREAARARLETDPMAFERYDREECDGDNTDDERQAFYAGADHGRQQLATLLKRISAGAAEERARATSPEPPPRATTDAPPSSSENA